MPVRKTQWLFGLRRTEEVLWRETLYTWGTATKEAEREIQKWEKRKGEHFGHTEGSRHLNVNLHSNMNYGDEEEDTQKLSRPCVRVCEREESTVFEPVLLFNLFEYGTAKNSFRVNTSQWQISDHNKEKEIYILHWKMNMLNAILNFEIKIMLILKEVCSNYCFYVHTFGQTTKKVVNLESCCWPTKCHFRFSVNLHM